MALTYGNLLIEQSTVIKLKPIQVERPRWWIAEPPGPPSATFPFPYIFLLPCFKQIKGSEKRKSLMVHVRVTVVVTFPPSFPLQTGSEARIAAKLSNHPPLRSLELCSFLKSCVAEFTLWALFGTLGGTRSSPHILGQAVGQFSSMIHWNQKTSLFYTKPGEHRYGVGIKNHNIWSATQCS